MLKRAILLAILLVGLVCVPAVQAMEEGTEGIDSETILEKQMNNLSLESVDKVVSNLHREVTQVLPQRNFRDMVGCFLKEGLKFDWKEFFNSIWRSLFKEIIANIKLLGELLVLAVITSLLKTFQDVFDNQGLAQVANGVVYLALIGIALNSFGFASEIGGKAITGMVDFINAVLPALFTLLIGTGALGTATIFQPVIFFLVSVIAWVIKTLVFPAIFLALILSVVSGFTGEFRLSRMGAFIKQIGITILGLSFVIFFGVILIQGAGVAVADGLSLRTAKYLTSTYIPIVGGMFANSLELVVGCSLLIENAVGLIGMLIIFITVAFPVLKILALVIIYKLASAVIQPVGDPLIGDCLNNLGNTLMLIFISVTTVAIMFFIFITITVGIANVTAMMR